MATLTASLFRKRGSFSVPASAGGPPSAWNNNPGGFASQIIVTVSFHLHALPATGNKGTSYRVTDMRRVLCQNRGRGYFPGGSGVKNPPSNAGEESWIPGQRTRVPHAEGQLSQSQPGKPARRSKAPAQPKTETKTSTLQSTSCVHAKSLQPCPTLCNHQAPLSMGLSRQEYWSGLPCPPPGDLLGPGTEPACLLSSTLVGGLSTTSAHLLSS